MKTKFLTIGLVLLSLMLFAHQTATATLMSDTQIYFDPASIVRNSYEHVYLPDLHLNNAVTWEELGDPVVDTDILPMLKNGDYGPDYLYSQSDYFRTPNIDYNAEITVGALTSTFDEGGLYHVRVTRQSGAEAIYAVFAQAGLGGGTGKTDKTQNKPVPEGDVFIVMDGGGPDDFLDSAYKALKFHGKNVLDPRPKTKKEVEDAIKKLTPKQHVEIVAHGSLTTELPSGREYGGTVDLGDTNLDTSNVQAFQETIDAYVDHLTFVSCNVAKGKEGKDFLKVLDASIDKVGAWDCEVTAYYTYNEATGETTSGGISAAVGGNYIPEPISLGLLGLGCLALARRRRRRK